MGEDRIISALIGLAGACNNNGRTDETDGVMIKALAFPAAGTDCDDEAVRELVNGIWSVKDSVAPGCATCPAPCGNTSDYDMRRLYEADEAVRRVKQQILEKLQKLAVCVCRDQKSGIEPRADIGFFYRALSYVGYDLDEADLLRLLDEAETKLLQEAETIEHDTGSGRESE